MAKKVEELEVYRKAMEFWEAVNAIVERPNVRRNFKLHDQIADANDSIPSNIAEGFEPLKKLITPAELAERLELGDSLARMVGRLIQYLAECDWKDRGRFKASRRIKP